MSDLSVNKGQPNMSGFVVPVVGGLGLILGFLTGNVVGAPLVGLLLGAVIGAVLAVVLNRMVPNKAMGRWAVILGFAVIGFLFGGLGGAVGGALIGAIISWFAYWIGRGTYRKSVPIYYTRGQTLWWNSFLFVCGAIFVFLITPILVVLPLSFNAEDFFTFTPEMLRLDPEGYSLKHYRDFFQTDDWQLALKNSLVIAPIATIISVSLGTLAAIGLSQSHVPFRRPIMAILISPMIVPLIISATGMFFFYSTLGNFLEGSLGMSKSLVGYIKVILAHAVLGIPFVIITVTATLVGFDRSLTRAAANMGADPVTTFFRVQMPLILPGVISGGLFAFITSFDEVVVVLFVGSAAQKTLPWQMFIGLREQISPTILAVATILVVISIGLLATVELLRRRSERLRGMSPG
ncbi:putative spermidine/putrescine transport system permease protein [Pseudooceanicola nitratireducens]|jgi:putative spermidine/putrescine transport system permease protein|uniref:Putative spermidine/putrescine transport system permease protein n=1 Tax=Pseudooceanicola nitratireducens TaxID=517719 RepID=A0A1I1HNU9_9RHOB|nr:ABC transporter permease [Pseudooceanicola nitratireducens]SEJ14219.1 putative spermidine/putrescine transport system permease protein [Pseudooceanicola nitratireducens]SFC25541.1 putative spermidine/putrescine transport system permease protein [Pseudooceanicola nitratireducens]